MKFRLAAKRLPESETDQGLKKRHYDSEKSKKCLTDAAADVFAKQGFDGATTREIAKKAGVNESLIQRYFESKLGLFSAVIDVCRAKMLETLPYEPGDTLEEELRAFFTYKLEFASKERKRMRLILSRSLVDQKFANKVGDIYQNGVPNLIVHLDLLQRRGKVGKNINLRTASLLIGAVTFVISTWTFVLSTISKQVSDELVELAIKVLSKGLTD